MGSERRNSGVSLLPISAAEGRCGSGFYSHPLSIERQRMKLVALEAMHDLRDIQWSPARVRGSCRSCETWVHGMGVDPTAALCGEQFGLTSFSLWRRTRIHWRWHDRRSSGRRRMPLPR